MAVYYGDMRVASDASEMYGFTMPCAKKAEDNDFTKENRFAYIAALSGGRELSEMDSDKSVLVTDSKGSIDVPYSDIVDDVIDGRLYLTSETSSSGQLETAFSKYVPALSVTTDKTALSSNMSQLSGGLIPTADAIRQYCDENYVGMMGFQNLSELLYFLQSLINENDEKVYVSKDGDDANGDGSEEAPYKTFGKAVQRINKRKFIGSAKPYIYLLTDLSVNFGQAVLFNHPDCTQDKYLYVFGWGENGRTRRRISIIGGFCETESDVRRSSTAALEPLCNTYFRDIDFVGVRANGESFDVESGKYLDINVVGGFKFYYPIYTPNENGVDFVACTFSKLPYVLNGGKTGTVINCEFSQCGTLFYSNKDLKLSYPMKVDQCEFIVVGGNGNVQCLFNRNNNASSYARNPQTGDGLVEKFYIKTARNPFQLSRSSVFTVQYSENPGANGGGFQIGWGLNGDRRAVNVIDSSCVTTARQFWKLMFGVDQMGYAGAGYISEVNSLTGAAAMEMVNSQFGTNIHSAGQAPADEVALLKEQAWTLKRLNYQNNVNYALTQNGVLMRFRMVGNQAYLGYGSAALSAHAADDSVSSLIIPNYLSGSPVVKINDYAFSRGSESPNSSKLAFINMPYTTLSVGDYAFADCLDLSSVTMPEGLTHIGVQAFAGLQNLGHLYIPNSVKHIGARAFAQSGISCINLPNSLTAISDGMLADTSISNINIPSGVRSIGEDAFAGTHLTGFVIPDGITDIKNGTFQTCEDLLYVSIPAGVSSIGDYAFNGCTSLPQDFFIPASVTSIGDQAFAGCGSIMRLHFSGPPPTCGADPFDGLGSDYGEAYIVVDRNQPGWPAAGELWNNVIVMYEDE